MCENYISINTKLIPASFLNLLLKHRFALKRVCYLSLLLLVLYSRCYAQLRIWNFSHENQDTTHSNNPLTHTPDLWFVALRQKDSLIYIYMYKSGL